MKAYIPLLRRILPILATLAVFSLATTVTRAAKPPSTGGGGATIADGIYALIAKHSGGALTASGTQNGSNVEQWSYDTGTDQQWQITNVGGTYKIVNVFSGKALEVSGASTSDGASISQWDYSGAANQRWIFQDRGNGYYSIHPSHASGKCADVGGASQSDGASVIQWSYSGSSNQLWALVDPSASGGNSVTLDPGDDIQLALNLYDTVILNPGTYSISAPLYIDSNTTLQGSGSNQSIIVHTGTAYNMLVNAEWPLGNVTIKNLTINGSRKRGDGINLADLTNSLIEDIVIISCSDMGLSCGGASGTTFRNLTIDKCGYAPANHHGIYNRRNTNCVFDGITVTNSDGCGIKLSIMDGVTLQNCTVSGSAWDGIVSQDLNYRMIFRNCTSNNNGSSGFSIYANSGSKIENCVSNDNGGFGYWTNTNDSGTVNTLTISTAAGNGNYNFDTHGNWSWDGYGNGVRR